MSEPPALIIYDGECIFCRSYVRLVRLREAIGAVELLDARSNDPRMAGYWRDGHDLNQGMLFIYRGVVHHGSDAVHVLARLSTASSVANRVNRAIFSRRFLAAALYPVLRLGRRLTLLLRGRRLMERPGLPPE